MSEVRKCPICLEQTWSKILEFDKNKSLTSDHRIISRSLNKSICTACGAGSNTHPWEEDDLKNFYSNDYTLNTGQEEEHVFFSGEKEVKRSDSYFQWIKPFLKPEDESLLEIGCGDGKILRRLRDFYPELTRLIGMEGATQSVEIARREGLAVEEGLILSSQDVVPCVEVYIAIGVLEHTSSPIEFLLAIQKNSQPSSRFIFTLPIQNKLNQDVLFSDHEWHFTTKHLEILFRRAYMHITHIDHENSLNPGMTLVVAENSTSKVHMPQEFISDNRVMDNMASWKDRLTKFDLTLNELQKQRIAIFGASEFLSLYYAYSELESIMTNVSYIIDETPNKQGRIMYGKKIYNIDHLTIDKVDSVILAVNPIYYPVITQKLEGYDIQIVYA